MESDAMQTALSEPQTNLQWKRGNFFASMACATSYCSKMRGLQEIWYLALYRAWGFLMLIHAGDALGFAIAYSKQLPGRSVTPT
jgi:hypothetical protein